MFYRMRLFYRMNFFTELIFFLRELNFLKRDTNIYFKQITFFEKKRFCKNHTYFFLKNISFFNLVLLHLNNHSQLQWSCVWLENTLATIGHLYRSFLKKISSHNKSIFFNDSFLQMPLKINISCGSTMQTEHPPR